MVTLLIIPASTGLFSTEPTSTIDPASSFSQYTKQWVPTFQNFIATWNPEHKNSYLFLSCSVVICEWSSSYRTENNNYLLNSFFQMRQTTVESLWRHLCQISWCWFAVKSRDIKS